MTLLLSIIYIAFISLGLPDALLGSAWPSMSTDLDVAVSYAGIISMIISAGTIISSLFSDKLTKILGTGKVTAISVAITAAALFGFSIAPSFTILCIIAFPYGLGAGAVDAALNNYVALHYKASHMSWLHCFWGIGATIGPYIMGACLTGGFHWSSGYRIISLLQILLTAVLVFTLPLWHSSKTEVHEKHIEEHFSLLKLLQLKGAKAALISFFCYCALEQTTGLWGASYMVMNRNMTAETAAKWASLFYLGITLGRFISGFLTMKINTKNMVRLGQGLSVLGIILLLLPFPNFVMCIGFIIIGLGCAPIYPSLLHQTPANFGTNLSQAIMGMQMACAYVGTTLMPPLFGFLAQYISIKLYPVYLFLLVIIMFIMVERLNKLPKHKV